MSWLVFLDTGQGPRGYLFCFIPVRGQESRPPNEDRWSSSARVSFPVLDVRRMYAASFQMCEKAT